MTREDAIKILKELPNSIFGIALPFDTGFDYTQALDMAIKALEQEPCEDCVSRKAVKEALRNRIGESISDCINAIPPVTPTRKKGKWIKGNTHEKYDYFGDRIRVANYTCSVCGRVIEDIGIDDDSFTNKLSDYPYCHCGAEMESREDGN